MEIVLATRNKKIEEIRRVTSDLLITILSPVFLLVPRQIEDRDTFEGNAVKKGVEVATCAGKPVHTEMRAGGF